MDNTIRETILNLSEKGYVVNYFEEIEEAKSEILKKINVDEDVGIGGSMTIYNMNLHKDLLNRGNKVYWHWLVDKEKRNDIRDLSKNTKVYLTSTNALTKDGKLVNIDGVGNRVASMIYGHRKVYVILGVNKIVENLDSAIERIKKVSCPKNAERLRLNTPCRKGECTDCKSKDRMCNVTVIIDNKPMNSDIEIIIINKELGF